MTKTASQLNSRMRRPMLLGTHLNPVSFVLTVRFDVNTENYSIWIGAKQLLSANEVSRQSRDQYDKCRQD